MYIKVSRESFDKLLTSSLADEFYEDDPINSVELCEFGNPSDGASDERRVLHLADMSFVEWD